MTNIQLSSESNEHYTPAEIVEAARRTMGSIDLDPASCEFANRTVKAAKFYSAKSGKSGIDAVWEGNVFLNPPGGSLRVARDDGIETARLKTALSHVWSTKSMAVAWWRKLCDEYKCGNVRSAVFVGFTLEILCTSQGSSNWPSCGHMPLCFVENRIKFTKPDGSSGDRPTHSNVIVYVGQNSEAFAREFSKFGIVRI
jgi:hypothetical protein